MSTALRSEDPIRLDSLIQYGAQAGRRAVPGPDKRWASAIGVSRSRASRHLNGDEHSPITRFLLSVATAGSPWPLLAEAIATVLGGTVRSMTVEQLLARLRQLDDDEHDRQAHEDRHTQRATVDQSAEQLEATATANIAEAELQLERAAILRELARRKRGV